MLVFAALALLIALLVASVAFIGGRRAQPALTAATNGLIAFASGTDIMVVQPDGTGRRTLVDGSDAIDSMAYSPDGGRLAYWAQAAAVTSWNLVVVDADGSDPVTIASGVLALTTPHIAWSPDGATIAYSGRTTVFDFPSCQAYENGDFCAISDLRGQHGRIQHTTDRRPGSGRPESRLVPGRLDDRIRRWQRLAGDRRAPLPDGCRRQERPAAQ